MAHPIFDQTNKTIDHNIFPRFLIYINLVKQISPKNVAEKSVVLDLKTHQSITILITVVIFVV